MIRLLIVLFFLVGCGGEVTPPPKPNCEDIPAIITTIDREPDYTSEFIPVESPCGEVTIHPMCDIRGGPGVFIFADNCTVHGVMPMNDFETSFLCDMWEPGEIPPEDIFDECPVPGLCGDPPLPEVPYE